MPNYACKGHYVHITSLKLFRKDVKFQSNSLDFSSKNPLINSTIVGVKT